MMPAVGADAATARRASPPPPASTPVSRFQVWLCVSGVTCITRDGTEEQSGVESHESQRMEKLFHPISPLYQPASSPSLESRWERDEGNQSDAAHAMNI